VRSIGRRGRSRDQSGGVARSIGGGGGRSRGIDGGGGSGGSAAAARWRKRRDRIKDGEAALRGEERGRGRQHHGEKRKGWGERLWGGAGDPRPRMEGRVGGRPARADERESSSFFLVVEITCSAPRISRFIKHPPPFKNVLCYFNN
jgi:hypothetical protein